MGHTSSRVLPVLLFFFEFLGQLLILSEYSRKGTELVWFSSWSLICFPRIRDTTGSLHEFFVLTAKGQLV